MPDRETEGLMRKVHDEVEKIAWIARAHRKLNVKNAPTKEQRMHVHVDLDVEIVEGHPAQVMALLREHLLGMCVSSEGVGCVVSSVAKIEIG